MSGYSAEPLDDRTTDVVLTTPFTPAKVADCIERVRRAAVAAWRQPRRTLSEQASAVCA